MARGMQKADNSKQNKNCNTKTKNNDDEDDDMGKSLMDDTSTLNTASDDAGDTFESDGGFDCSLRHETDLVLDKLSEHSSILHTDDERSSYHPHNHGQTSWNHENNNEIQDEEGPFFRCTPSGSNHKHSFRLQQLGPPSEMTQWQISEIASNHSRAINQDGYACEMLWDNQGLFQSGKPEFLKDKNLEIDGDEEQTTSASTSAKNILDGVKSAMVACGDGIDRVLIRLFDVRVEEVETRPSYAVSVAETLTEDMIHNSQQPDRSTIKTTKDVTEMIVAQDIQHTYLISANPPEEHEDIPADPTPHSSKESEDLRNSESEARDDLDDILGDDFQEEIISEAQVSGPTTSNESPGSAERFKESSYLDSEEAWKSPTPSVPRKVDVTMENDTKTLSEESESGSTQSVAAALDKFLTASKTDKMGDIYHEKYKVLRDKVSEIESRNSRISTEEDNPMGGMAFSTIYRKHVEELINKNLSATNRSDIVELSQVDPLPAYRGESFQSTRDSPPVQENPQTSPLPSSSSSSIHSASVEQPLRRTPPIEDDVDYSLNKRREKLRKMMADLNLPRLRSKLEEIDDSECDVLDISKKDQHLSYRETRPYIHRVEEIRERDCVVLNVVDDPIGGGEILERREIDLTGGGTDVIAHDSECILLDVVDGVTGEGEILEYGEVHPIGAHVEETIDLTLYDDCF